MLGLLPDRYSETAQGTSETWFCLPRRRFLRNITSNFVRTRAPAIYKCWPRSALGLVDGYNLLPQHAVEQKSVAASHVSLCPSTHCTFFLQTSTCVVPCCRPPVTTRRVRLTRKKITISLLSPALCSPHLRRCRRRWPGFVAGRLPLTHLRSRVLALLNWVFPSLAPRRSAPSLAEFCCTKPRLASSAWAPFSSRRCRLHMKCTPIELQLGLMSVVHDSRQILISTHNSNAALIQEFQPTWLRRWRRKLARGSIYWRSGQGGGGHRRRGKKTEEGTGPSPVSPVFGFFRVSYQLLRSQEEFQSSGSRFNSFLFTICC